jgi:ABC-type branched-subunit amino acid transport system ATPase component
VTGAALEIAGLTKDYRGLRPLRIQQLTVDVHDSVAILGLDQAAAETFVNLVTGSTLPDSGTVHVLGRATASIADGDEWLGSLDRFGIVSARAVLLDTLTVTQNLAMPFTLEIEPPADDVRRRAEAIAGEVGLREETWTTRVAELTAAGCARVRLGRALAVDPALLLLEHASAGLAAADGAALGRDIRQIAARRGIALVAAGVDEAFARAVAARVLTLDPATGRLGERRRWFSRT